MFANMIRPPSLVPGDTVGILAPARKVSRKEMAPALDIIKKWGYEVQEGKHLYGSDNQFSGTDAERASDFQDMLDNPAIKAVFCARGGYGSLRIIDKLDFSSFVKDNPFKLERILDNNIAGFSNAAVNTRIIPEKVQFSDSIIAVDWYFFSLLIALTSSDKYFID